MEQKKVSNKESFKEVQKYKNIIAVLSVVSAFLAFIVMNQYTQLQQTPTSIASSEIISEDFPTQGGFVQGERAGPGGGGRNVAKFSEIFEPVLSELVDDGEITQDQLDLILETLESYDPFN